MKHKGILEQNSGWTQAECLRRCKSTQQAVVLPTPLGPQIKITFFIGSSNLRNLTKRPVLGTYENKYSARVGFVIIQIKSDEIGN